MITFKLDENAKNELGKICGRTGGRYIQEYLPNTDTLKITFTEEAIEGLTDKDFSESCALSFSEGFTNDNFRVDFSNYPLGFYSLTGDGNNYTYNLNIHGFSNDKGVITFKTLGYYQGTQLTFDTGKTEGSIKEYLRSNPTLIFDPIESEDLIVYIVAKQVDGAIIEVIPGE